MIEVNKIYNEPCLDTLNRMENESVDCVITSPPYWQLRDYGYGGQWGLEPTFNQYLEHLWEMMDEIFRVLKPTGTVWVNLGDTYNGSKRGNDDPKLNDEVRKSTVNKTKGNLRDKTLLLIPHRFAIGCMDRGWIVRNDIIWAKRNAMPESVTDRFSKKHEYFFFLTKSERYFFDLHGIRDKSLTPKEIQKSHTIIPKEDCENYGSPRARVHRNIEGKMTEGGLTRTTAGLSLKSEQEKINQFGKNPGSVSDFWDIPTKPSSDAHYAQYNDELLKKPVIAGCPEFVCNKCGKPREKIIENTPMIIKRSNRREEMGQANGTAASGTMIAPAENKVIGLTDCGCNAGFSGGIIYDPFMGSGTTAKMALRTNRRFIGSEMSEKYFELAEKGLVKQRTQTTLF